VMLHISLQKPCTTPFNQRAALSLRPAGPLLAPLAQFMQLTAPAHMMVRCRATECVGVIADALTGGGNMDESESHKHTTRPRDYAALQVRSPRPLCCP